MFSGSDAFVRLALKVDVGGKIATTAREIPVNSLEPLFDAYMDLLKYEMRAELHRLKEQP